MRKKSKIIQPIFEEGTFFNPTEMEIRLVEGAKVQKGKKGGLDTREFWGFRRPGQIGIAQIIDANDFEEFKINLQLYFEKTNRKCLINAYLKSVPIKDEEWDFTTPAALVAFMDKAGGHVFYFPSYHFDNFE